jgi:hypothetical protein
MFPSDQLLDETLLKGASKKEYRQAIAGLWRLKPITTARRFRAYEDECLDAFRFALLDFLNDEQSVSSLTSRLGLRVVRPDGTEAVMANESAEVAVSEPPRNQPELADPPSHSMPRKVLCGILNRDLPFRKTRG